MNLLALLCLFLGAAAATLTILMTQNLRGSERSRRIALESEKAVLNERLLSREARIEELSRESLQDKARLEKSEQEVRALDLRLTEAETRREEETQGYAEKLALLEKAREKLAESFQALASEALSRNNQNFLELAKTSLEKYQEGAKNDLENRKKAIDDLVRPVTETLGKFDGKLKELEEDRIRSYVALREQVSAMAATQESLKSETSRLVQTLKAPAVRGNWGEVQLRRVVELAGMVNYCDFEEQVSVKTEEGKLRPDLIVRLPNNKVIVVDAKAPLEAFLKSVEAVDDLERKKILATHAGLIRNHIKRLSEKDYWNQFKTTPDFVVMFLPGEAIFNAALSQDPSLIEEGVQKRVIIASPTTLIALLKAVHFGWRQEALTENAEKISQLGKELYERLFTMVDHFDKVGRGLGSAVDNYNKAMSSLERRVLVSARRFQELRVGEEKEIPALDTIDQSVKVFPSQFPAPKKEQEEERG